MIEATLDVVHDINGRLDSGWDWRTSIVFVPDPEHTWGSDKKEECTNE